MQKIRIILRSIGLLLLVVSVGLNIFNPDQRFRLAPKRHDLVSLEKQETEHIIMYGGDPKLAEQIYVQLQVMLGAFYVNKRVKIYVAKPSWGVGIGHYKGTLYAGIYRRSRFGPDVIIYNGSVQTLAHELIHFFTSNMKKQHISEILAQMVPKYKELGMRYQTLVKAVMKSRTFGGYKIVQGPSQTQEETVQA